LSAANQFPNHYLHQVLFLDTMYHKYLCEDVFCVSHLKFVSYSLHFTWCPQTVLVPCYSSDYDSADRRVDYDSQSAEGVFYGYKWQCVEFARRWLVLNKRVTFQSIPMAYHIFQLPNVIRLSDGQRLPMIGHLNGSTTHPMAGDVLIWSAGGNKIGRTGHVAIITAASSEWVRVAEQVLCALPIPVADADAARY
jgi:hypothetical protein